jgi:ATP-binding cassette, subfamily B, bacterial PglK
MITDISSRNKLGKSQYKILEVFEKKHKIKMLLMFLFMFIVSFLELLSIGTILPVFSVIFNQDYLLKVNNFFENTTILNIQFESHEDLIFYSLVVFFLVFTFKNMILVIYNWVQQSFSKDFIDHLSISLFEVFINQPYEFYFNAKSSDLVRDLNSEPSALVKNLFIPLCIMIMESIILVGLVSFLIFFYGSYAAGALVIVLGIIGTTLYFTRNIIKKWGGLRYQFETQKIKTITESFDNIKDIIIKTKNNFFFQRFQKFVKLVTKSILFGGFYKTLPKILVEQLIIVLFIIYFLFYYNLEAIDDNFFAKLIFLGTILIRVVPGLIRLSSSYQTIKFAAIGAENIYEFLNINKRTILDSKKEIEFNNCIEFQNVDYKFEGYDKNVLSSINFKIKKNQTIGIVGRTGSGKTTLLDVFLGLLKPTAGRILVDKRDCTFELNQSGWHKKIGYISQNVTLIDDTIKNNIALGITEDQIDINTINDVIIKANLREFIDSLTDGIETIVGEKGIKLSGGQIQRLGIARAIYSDPEILCLDEATSSLDYQTENEILKTMMTIKKNKTVIIIAHRLKTIENCEEIIELSNGKINRITTPKEILKNSNN